MTELLSLLVVEPRRCRLASTRPFEPLSGAPSVQVVEWMLFLLRLGYELPDAMTLLRLQSGCSADLSGAALLVTGHDLAIEASGDRAALIGTAIYSIATADDAWQMMRLIASHCDAQMPCFAFLPL